MGGPEFAVLHHRYRHFNRARRKYRSSNRNVLVDLGESLEYRIFRDVVDIVSRYIKNVKIVPGYFLKKGNKKTLKRIYQNVRFAGKADSYARAYFEADVALIPPGLEANQAAAVGTPALYLPVDEKSDQLACELEKRQLGFNLGVAGTLSRERFKEQLSRLSFDTRLEMGSIGKGLVDGRGAGRIIDFFEKNVII
jgi:spore coat polysaccharide biosynthesis predicted glycosyltransferase SpsG